MGRTPRTRDAALYPLFDTELIEAMRRLLPPDRHEHVATAVLVTGRRAT